ncbi:MAG: peptidoglycan DD-metalloendopeptidase family protein, partial [Anaerolineae bacterium]
MALGLLVALVVALLAAGGGGPAPAVAHRVATATATQAPTATASETPSPRPTATEPTASTRPATPGVTRTPASTPTDTPAPSPTAARTASPTAPTPPRPAATIIGQSVDGRPITARRVGQGPIKVVLVGDIHGAYEANTYELARLLQDYFEAHPEEVPSRVSLWIVPSMNPDGLATGHRWNAGDVDLNRNADTDLDGCGGNDWSPDTVGYEGTYAGAGGEYPFSEPETRAMRDFMADAWVTVFYHSAAEAIYADSCQRHLPSIRLAEAVSEGSGYPVPPEGWSGYPITGEFGDYLAGEGVASVTVELTDHDDPEFERNLAGVQALLAAVDEIVGAEAAAAGGELAWLEPEAGGNTGAWTYTESSFPHPIALEVSGDRAYLLDGGRVLALDLDEPAAPRPILAAGDYVEEVRVLEPLDLAAEGEAVLVLDRAGDVYRYDPAGDTWTVARYDRPVRDTYDHYFVALTAGPAANYLLETTHEQVWRFAAPGAGSDSLGAAWVKLPQSRDVDASAGGGAVYVLTRNLNNPIGSLLRYPMEGTPRRDGGFVPGVELIHPRQVVATEGAIYVLDRAGRRLLALAPDSGALQSLHQFPDRRAVSAIWADPESGRLILAGRDRLYFYEEPVRQARVEVPVDAVLQGPQPHDPDLQEGLRGLLAPIEGAGLTSRDFQMPGAPRHYRLGVHEGIDFYGHTVGVTVKRGTPVRAVADGVVVRALVDYQPLTAAQAEAWQAESVRQGYTPAEVLDGYRGRQVWIDHGDGLVSRYAHLDGIEPGIVEGAAVRQGQMIATVGNSGTPNSLSSDTYDAHLHLELWIGEHFAGQFLRPIEAREWLER